MLLASCSSSPSLALLVGSECDVKRHTPEQETALLSSASLLDCIIPYFLFVLRFLCHSRRGQHVNIYIVTTDLATTKTLKEKVACVTPTLEVLSSSAWKRRNGLILNHTSSSAGPDRKGGLEASRMTIKKVVRQRGKGEENHVATAIHARRHTLLPLPCALFLCAFLLVMGLASSNLPTPSPSPSVRTKDSSCQHTKRMQDKHTHTLAHRHLGLS
jgi:hypothetical protein